LQPALLEILFTRTADAIEFPAHGREFSIQPELRSSGGHSVGGTGHWPVPGGDPPLGTGSAPNFFGRLF